MTTAMAILTAAWTIAFFFSFLLICNGQPGDYWKSAADEKAFCVQTQKLHVAFSISDTIMDIIIMGMSIPIVRSLPF